MRTVQRSEKRKDAKLLALKLLEETASQGMQAAPQGWKRQGTDLPLEPPEGTRPSWHLDFSPVKQISDF